MRVRHHARRLPEEGAPVSAKLTRSFLLGRSMGDAVTYERELAVSELIQRGLPNAALATKRSHSIKEYLRLRDDMNRKRLDGQREKLVVIIRCRILSSLDEEARGH